MITYIADISGDVDDVIAIEYLHKSAALNCVVLDGHSRDSGRKEYLEKLGVRFSEKIEDEIVFCGGAFTPIKNHIEGGGGVKLVVANGFFAGANIVPPEYILPKFKDRITCPSYNPNLDVVAAEFVLANCPCLIVSKNVCHHKDNVINKWHGEHQCSPTKLLHDLLMVKEGLNYINGKEMMCEYAPVFIYRQGREWACVSREDSKVRISLYKKD